MDITAIVTLALFVETVIGALKPLWNRDAQTFSATEIISILLGVAIACICKIDMISAFVAIEHGVFTDYLFYAMTGIAIGRGPSFVYDLWQRIRSQTPAA